MPDIEETIARLRGEVGQLQQQKAGAEHELRLQQTRHADALADLEREFGVRSLEEAKTLLGVTRDELEAQCRSAEAALAAAGGTA